MNNHSIDIVCRHQHLRRVIAATVRTTFQSVVGENRVGSHTPLHVGVLIVITILVLKIARTKGVDAIHRVTGERTGKTHVVIPFGENFCRALWSLTSAASASLYKVVALDFHPFRGETSVSENTRW